MVMKGDSDPLAMISCTIRRFARMLILFLHSLKATNLESYHMSYGRNSILVGENAITKCGWSLVGFAAFAYGLWATHMMIWCQTHSKIITNILITINFSGIGAFNRHMPPLNFITSPGEISGKPYGFCETQGGKGWQLFWKTPLYIV